MKYSDTDNSISFDYEKPELFAFAGDPMIVEGGGTQENVTGAEDEIYDGVDGDTF